MRVTKERAAENRERILTEAARLFRERGVSAVGMDALAEAAGMTHGSLYSQFDSKEHLAAEALGRAFDASAANYGGGGNFFAYVGSYFLPRPPGGPRTRGSLLGLCRGGPPPGEGVRGGLSGGGRRLMGG